MIAALIIGGALVLLAARSRRRRLARSHLELLQTLVVPSDIDEFDGEMVIVAAARLIHHGGGAALEMVLATALRPAYREVRHRTRIARITSFKETR